MSEALNKLQAVATQLQPSHREAIYRALIDAFDEIGDSDDCAMNDATREAFDAIEDCFSAQPARSRMEA